MRALETTQGPFYFSQGLAVSIRRTVGKGIRSPLTTILLMVLFFFIKLIVIII